MLKCINISKSFGPTKALSEVNLEVKRGEIHGLIGENGSGKSTLSSIIAGTLAYDSGQMLLEGQEYKPSNMVEAQNRGIAMIVQESGTIDRITVAANIFVNKEERFKTGPLLSKKKMEAEAGKILEELGLGYIEAAADIRSLNFEDRKLVEIARCMYDEPDLLIVDETTTAISHRGRELIYRIMKKMAEGNKAVLFISHDLDELMSVCTKVSILRDGCLVTELDKKDINVHDMRMYMIGRNISDNYYRNDYDGTYGEEVVLRAEHISNNSNLEDFSFELHKGEILGFGGLSECGMHEVGRAVFGADRLLTGRVEIVGKGEIKSPQDAISYHVAYVSKNRDTESVIQEDTIRNNIILPSIPVLENHMFISPQKEKRLVNKEIEEMSVKCENMEQMVNQLSGGNKQKVVFAKWLGNGSEILILDCPARGIDIGVKVSMYQMIYALKREGKAIILISEELPELIGMSDRILILKDGKLAKEFERNENLKESDIIQYMI